MAAVPVYDVSLDELSVALSYATMSLGDAAVPIAPKKTVATPAAPKTKDVPKKAEKKEAAKKKVCCLPFSILHLVYVKQYIIFVHWDNLYF
jgi:predicted histidine transporter YuiF (NhaC family)